METWDWLSFRNSKRVQFAHGQSQNSEQKQQQQKKKPSCFVPIFIYLLCINEILFSAFFFVYVLVAVLWFTDLEKKLKS